MTAASERRARVGAVVDRVWGEDFVLSPRARPNGDPEARPIADAERPAFGFVGRFMARSEDQHARSRATSLQETRAFSTAAPTITTVTDHLVAPIREADLVTRLASGETFTVTKVKDGEFGRLVLLLRSGPR